MTKRRPGPRLFGRGAECEALDRLVAAVRGGHSSVLVLRGDPGIGKTVLLDHVAGAAADCRLVRVAGVESEMELAFGGLHQLCAPFLDHLDHLPEPQRAALGTAFGLSAGEVPERFLVGLAVLSLLADVAEGEPLICVIDDAQWLDRVSVQTLAFVARRLLAERVGLVLAVREPFLVRELAGLPEAVVRGLGDADARALLASVVPGRLDRAVRDRFVAETQGNPLALSELPRGLTPAELAGGFGRPDARRLVDRIEESFLRRVAELPAETRRLLLIAAADPVGDVALLARAAESLGIEASAAAPAEAAGLVSLGTRVRFRHPLVRSAAYRVATTGDRQKVHAALAEATDPATDPDRRVWHLANAAAGPDEAVAAELERSAGRAQARGGVAAEAAFLERAAELTPDPARRGARTLASAQARYQAGGYDDARELLQAADLGPLDPYQIAQADLLRGRIAFASTSAHAALPLLMKAAKRLEPLDPRLARETYRDALYAALTTGQVTRGAHLRDVAEATLSAPPGPHPGRNDLLLGGLAAMTTEGYAAGLPMVLQALRSFRADDLPPAEALGWLPFACRAAHDVWDFESWSVLAARLVGLARETGVLSVMPSALLLLLSNRVYAGDLAVAEGLVTEARTIADVTGSHFIARYAALVPAPWKGGEATTRQAVEAVVRDASLDGEGKVATATHWAKAVLGNGHGRYEEAYAAARRGCEHPQEMGLALQSTVELVEAAVRSDRPARAAEAARTLREMADAAGSDWALGTAAMAGAQVAGADEAENLYREAVERLDRTEVRTALARSRLLYGEWLRRRNRRVDAREQLGAAYEMFGQMGARAFAERARRELQATGETVRKRTPAAAAVTLTAQEMHIARLAGEGMTNPEIGAQLFISAHTVEWHLRKVFTKLGITSRRQISASLLEHTAITA
ncbi:AAA family ATPase [Streptomyces sp. WMMC500]|uniref:helix-turn-helix transcriptional regulator n=1 Tax=Streptomyces sp. WMMC500 TaxID=3015154 RepID=UPI00248BDB97|nr:AAA family ATPase [Streptomyces sp. WMMC500]WBB62467.1 AAA family ATPase [Streptomyces sp. WMMC500]